MKVVFAVMVLMLFSLPAFAAPGAGDVHAGNDFYRKGKFQEALEHYQKAAEKNPAEARIEYNLGAAAYKAGDYDAAVEHFQKSLLTDDDKLRRDVHFNLGDAFYRAGISREDKDIEQGIKRLESSLGSFEKARQLDVKDKEASENYEFVKKEIERLEQKKQQQQQQKQQRQQQKNDQQKDQAQQDQQKSEGEKSQEEKDHDKKDQDTKGQQGEDPEKKKEETSDKGDKSDQKDKKDDKSGEDSSRNDVPDKEGKKDQPEPSKDQSQPDGTKNDQNNSASGQTVEGQISSQKDANDMVDNFERNELPKGLLNFIRPSRETRAVDKDW